MSFSSLQEEFKINKMIIPIQLPENMTTSQIKTFNKNCDLYMLAVTNINIGCRKYGSLVTLCFDLGIQDAVFWDVDKFINVYPYSIWWLRLSREDR